MEYRAGEWTKTDFIRLNLSGQRHGHVGTAMEAATESDNARASGVTTGNFNRVFHRFCAGGKEGGFGLAFNRGQLIDFSASPT